MSQNPNSVVFSEPISPAERYEKDMKSGSASNMKYGNEVAGGKWEVETDEPETIRQQVMTLLPQEAEILKFDIILFANVHAMSIHRLLLRRSL
jgi:hypothetical protein